MERLETALVVLLDDELARFREIVAQAALDAAMDRDAFQEGLCVAVKLDTRKNLPLSRLA